MNIKFVGWLLLSILFSLSGTEVLAQLNKEGVPKIDSYHYSVTGGNEWNDYVISDNRGIYYFATSSGRVLEFDGHKWNSYPTRGDAPVKCLVKDKEGIIYLGSAYEFGFLEPDEFGFMKYHSLSERLDSAEQAMIKIVFKVEYFEGEIYFVTKGSVYKYNKINDLLTRLNISDEYYTFFNICSINDRLILSDNRNGLVEIIADTIKQLPGGDNFAMDYCTIILPYDDDWLIIGTILNGIVLYNQNTGEVRSDFISKEDNDILITKNVWTGTILPNGNFAVGNQTGGVFIFDRSGAKVGELSNQYTSMQDDIAINMYYQDVSNQNSQLWISSSGYIHKVGYNLPFKIYGQNNEITYFLTAIEKFNNSLYSGGDKGIAKLLVEDGKISFKQIDGINEQINTIERFSYGNREFLLVGGLFDLYIIDKDDKVSSFAKSVIGSGGAPMNAIHSIHKSKYHDGLVYCGAINQIKLMTYQDSRWSYLGLQYKGIQGTVISFAEESAEKLWFSTRDREILYSMEISNGDTLINEYTGEELQDSKVTTVTVIDGRVYVSADNGIFVYNELNSRFELVDQWMLKDPVHKFRYERITSLGNYGVMVSGYDYQNVDYIVKADGTKFILPFYFLPKSSTEDYFYKNGKLLLTKSKQIYNIDLVQLEKFITTNDVLIRNVTISNDSILFGGTFFELNSSGKKVILKNQTESMIRKINHKYNDVSFAWSSNNLLQEDSTTYSFMIEHFDDDWSKWDKIYYKDYTNLPHGRYTFRVRAKDLTRQISAVAEYEFEILRPWYQSLVAFFVYAVFIILFIIGIIKVYTRRLLSENLRLEGIVADRTREVVRQKEELEDSIHYASRIQRAILPTEKSLQDKVEDYFILFRPRDIVSGDFYWVSEKGPRLFIVAADCTGHGVPGAFMSILGVSFLDEIINKTESIQTSAILNQLRSHVTESLKQLEGGDEETKDGMDLGLLVINKNEKKIEFSGAYNPCWVVRELTPEEKHKYTKGELEMGRNNLSNGQHILETIDADRMPIGVSSRMGQSFTMRSQELKKGESYYLLSDGYSDQFGGDKGRKFLKKNLKKLILEVQGIPMSQQRDLLEKRLIDWMGGQDQVDDILIMGIRAI